MATPQVVGIDLGTTTTMCSFIDVNGQPKYLAASHSTFQSSVVNIRKNQSDDGMCIGVGELEHVSGVFYAKETKRIIGTRYDNKKVLIQAQREDLDYKIVPNQQNGLATCRFIFKNGKFYDISPEQVATMVLKHVTNFRKENSLKAVITVPAEFGVFQKHATLQAAKNANIEVMKLLPEPSAAAYYYFKKNPERNEGHYLIFDFGGGTLDISLIAVEKIDEKLKFSVKWVEGDSTLGGADIDNMVFEEFLLPNIKQRGYTLTTGSLTSHKQDSKMRMRHALSIRSKELKEELCTGRKNVKEFYVELENDDFLWLEVGFERFKEECERKFKYRVQSLLEKFKIKLEKDLKTNINEVLMVGGSSLVPFVGEWIGEVFPDVIVTQPKPDEAMQIVSYGASYLAHDIQMEQEIPITECLSRTISFREMAAIHKPLWPMFEKGEPLTCEFEIPVTNSKDDSKKITLVLLEGEGKNRSETELLTHAIIEIDPLPARSHKIGVKARVNNNGVLSVEVHDFLKNMNLFSKDFTFSTNDRQDDYCEEIDKDILQSFKELTEKCYFVKEYLSTIRQENNGDTKQALTDVMSCISFIESFHGIELSRLSITRQLEKMNHWYNLIPKHP